MYRAIRFVSRSCIATAKRRRPRRARAPHLRRARHLPHRRHAGNQPPAPRRAPHGSPRRKRRDRKSENDRHACRPPVLARQARLRTFLSHPTVASPRKRAGAHFVLVPLAAGNQGRAVAVRRGASAANRGAESWRVLRLATPAGHANSAAVRGGRALARAAAR